ncbi:hypothetical protein PGT21_002495 [Puccinia graminis f. sp. tritici]|uniref:Uncharacterized protein n=1 Tax=Puccinia graminis f. sp. tritici TaxID=56615 RepID=A0A5B0LV33_PUCGR|nr:hypothetical protein PGT21_002495 [Puccinia graminis f. sp. tritici]
MAPFINVVQSVSGTILREQGIFVHTSRMRASSYKKPFLCWSPLRPVRYPPARSTLSPDSGQPSGQDQQDDEGSSIYRHALGY